MSESTAESQTAMLLTDTEWRMLADICECYLNQPHPVESIAPGHARLAGRIIQAVR